MYVLGIQSAAAAAVCVAILLLLLQQRLLRLLVIVCRMVKLCWFIESDSSVFVLFIRTRSILGSCQKYLHLVRMGPKNRYILKSSQNAPREPRHWSKTHCACFCRIKPRYTRVCLLCWAFNCFYRFLANQRRSIFPPYALFTNADVRGDPLYPPHPTPRQKSNTCTYLPASRRSHEAPAL